MSLFTALNSATAGLRAVQSSVKLVSDNITRADDPTRSHQGSERITDSTGAVVGVTYTRRTDEALRHEYEDMIGRDGGATTQSKYLTQVGDLLGTTDGVPGLTDAVQKFAAAWQDLQNAPENITAQRQVISTGDSFARKMRQVASAVEDLDTQIKDDTRITITTLNDYLKQMHQMNVDIVSMRGEGSTANEIRDRREDLLRKINEILPVRTVESKEGGLVVFTANGMALVDADATQFTYDGTNVSTNVAGAAKQMAPQLQEGKLGSLLKLREDNSSPAPAKIPSSDPATEIIRKLRSQLDALANAFVGTTKAGEPTSFADAYNNATPAQDGELADRFFQGTDRFTIKVDQRLLDDTLKLKQTGIHDAATAMNASGRSLSADGISVVDQSYATMTGAVMASWSSASKTVSDMAKETTATKNSLEERYHGKVGVNLDEEIANLQVLQTSYAATARVMQVTNGMFDALERILG